MRFPGTVSKKSSVFLGLGAFACLIASCVSMPKMLPAEYFNPKHTLAVRVTACAPKPELRTETQKGNIAAITDLVRQKAMEDRMMGITPERITAALTQELKNQLGDLFLITSGDAQLLLEVEVEHWGWYVPTGKYGESTDIHYLHLSGQANIFDPAHGSESVYYTANSTDTPLGDHLTAEKCEAVFPLAVADFSAQIKRFIAEGNVN